MISASTTHRGYGIRHFGALAVVVDHEGRRVHRSTVVPSRVAEQVAERAYQRELSSLITRIACTA